MRVKLKRVIFRDEKKKVSALTKVQKSDSFSIDGIQMEGGKEKEISQKTNEHETDDGHGHGHGHGHGNGDDHDHDHGDSDEENETIAKLRKLKIVKSYIKTVEKKRKISKAKLIESQKNVILKGRSLCIFSTTNPLRVFLSKIVVHNIFEMFIFGVVLFSAILMGLEDPL